VWIYEDALCVLLQVKRPCTSYLPICLDLRAASVCDCDETDGLLASYTHWPHSATYLLRILSLCVVDAWCSERAISMTSILSDRCLLVPAHEFRKQCLLHCCSIGQCCFCMFCVCACGVWSAIFHKNSACLLLRVRIHVLQKSWDGNKTKSSVLTKKRRVR
jgi:hypothetical protein